MQFSGERGHAIRLRARQRRLLIAVMIFASYGLTLYVFYPGIMTYDARYVYEDIAKGFRGDWQSPVMTVLWSLIDPLAPGPGSMLLLIISLYWLGFGLLALTIARRSMGLAVGLLLLALSPPSFAFVGIIWRDVLFASAWLLAAALVFAFSDYGAKARGPAQILAFGALALGILLRPNSLLAAPILGVYIAWPTHFSWKRAIIIYLPAVFGFFALVQIVYYGVLGATRQHPLQSIMVFDLGGITHFTKKNQFPVSWTAPETTLLTERCYQPTQWDIYWTHEPCRFVMDRLDGEKIFGSRALVDAWRRAIAKHPGAYLQHRIAFMWNFLSAANFTMWTRDLDDPSKVQLAGKPAFTALREMHDALKSTLLFRAGPWLLLNAVTFAFAWYRRDTPAGAFALGVCGSALAYVMTFLAVGVAGDFRYAYWAVLAGLAGLVVIAQFKTWSGKPALDRHFDHAG